LEDLAEAEPENDFHCHGDMESKISHWVSPWREWGEVALIRVIPGREDTARAELIDMLASTGGYDREELPGEDTDTLLGYALFVALPDRHFLERREREREYGERAMAERLYRQQGT